jgi:hypothetical protein
MVDEAKTKAPVYLNWNEAESVMQRKKAKTSLSRRRVNALRYRFLKERRTAIWSMPASPPALSV